MKTDDIILSLSRMNPNNYNGLCSAPFLGIESAEKITQLKRSYDKYQTDVLLCVYVYRNDEDNRFILTKHWKRGDEHGLVDFYEVKPIIVEEKTYVKITNNNNEQTTQG